MQFKTYPCKTERDGSARLRCRTCTRQAQPKHELQTGCRRNSEPKTHACFLYLNLLIMTATIRRTKTVMMDMVMIRFVAILIDLVSHACPGGAAGFTLPSRHPSQRLDAPVDITLAVEQCVVCVLDHLALPLQVRQGVCADGLSLVGESLASLEALCTAV